MPQRNVKRGWCIRPSMIKLITATTRAAVRKCWPCASDGRRSGHFLLSLWQAPSGDSFPHSTDEQTEVESINLSQDSALVSGRSRS